MKHANKLFITLRRLFAAATLTAAATASAQYVGPATEQGKIMLDSLKAKLLVAETPQDSLPLLVDIFDITPNDAPLMHIRRIYYAAKASGKLDLQFDMMRQWVSFGLHWRDNGVLEDALAEFEQMPDCEDKRQTQVFIDIGTAEHHLFKSDADRESYLRQLLRECADMTDDDDPYLAVTKLSVLVYMLEQETQGDLMSKYMGRLEKAIDALPPLYHNYLRARINARAANNYWANDEYLKSVNADRNLLLLNKRLQKYLEKNGRYHKSFDTINYYAIRRILRNYDILREEEVRELHSQIMDMVKTNPEIAKLYNSDPTARIGILELDGKYAQGIALLKPMIEHAQTLNNKRMYLRWLIRFADKAGDEATKFEAEKMNAELLENYYNNYKSDERSRELKLLYEVNNLRRIATAERLQREREKTRILYAAGIVLILVLITFMVLYGNAYRLRRAGKKQIAQLKQELSKKTKKCEELDTLRATMRRMESEKMQLFTFLSHELSTPLAAIINYSRMIVENTTDDTRDYMHNFAAIIEVNANILQEVANDMGEFEVSEGKKLQLHRVPVDSAALAEITIESIKPNLKDSVTAEVMPIDPSADHMIITDPRRVQMVLLSCISNMALLLERGKISVGVEKSGDECTYAITVSGSKVSDEEAQKVFDAWKNFDEDAKIEGLGLPNCQMIVEALGAQLRLDPSHNDAHSARLLFTIPAK